MRHLTYSACIATATLCGAVMLSSCGYHLRGYDSPVFQNKYIVLNVDKANQIHNKTSRNLEKHITNKLLVLGASVESNYSKRNNLYSAAPKNTSTTQVQVNAIDLRKHKLVGTLTEIQLIMTTDIRISSTHKGSLDRTLQVQRSYQYDQATVNTENQQEDRIIELMNEALADKVVRQVSLYERVNVK